MPFYLVIDFETTGVGSNKCNPSQMPLPRPNYPVQLAAELLDSGFNFVKSKLLMFR